MIIYKDKYIQLQEILSAGVYLSMLCLYQMETLF